MRFWKVIFIGLLVLSVATLPVMYHTLSIKTVTDPPRASNHTLHLHALPRHASITVSISRTASLSAGRTTKTTKTLLPSTVWKPSVICISFDGRLGNHLFQYVSVLGLSRKLQRIPVYSPSALLNSALQHPVPAAKAEHTQRCKKAPLLKEQACCAFDKNFSTLDPGKDYRVGKYLQSWKYFEGMEAEVRQVLVFKDSVVRQVNEIIEALRKWCNQTLIGVHVRRGDYFLPQHVKLGYRTAPADYYHKAMNYMRKRFGNVTFVVSVDDKKWFTQSVTSASDAIILPRHLPTVDMALLSSLDHVITSVGTFSWWVGYLNKGVTVYYRDFIVPGTFIGGSFNRSTFIYPGWIPF